MAPIEFEKLSKIPVTSTYYTNDTASDRNQTAGTPRAAGGEDRPAEYGIVTVEVEAAGLFALFS